MSLNILKKIDISTDDTGIKKNICLKIKLNPKLFQEKDTAILICDS